jgi:hypothetical protein
MAVASSESVLIVLRNSAGTTDDHPQPYIEGSNEFPSGHNRCHSHGEHLKLGGYSILLDFFACSVFLVAGRSGKGRFRSGLG